ncbi:MAG: glycosyltransferase family 1 protein [Pseudomonadota bacterium]
MRIAIVTETYAPEINGVALTIERIVRCLCDLGHELTVVHPRRAESAPIIHGAIDYAVPGLPVPNYPDMRFGLPMRRRLRRIFSERRPEAVYIATEGPLGGAALKEARRFGVPVLTGFHTRFDQYASYYGLSFLQRFVENYLRRFHNASDGTVVPTPDLRRQLEEEGYDNVFLLERAVDVNRFHPSRRSEARREAWGIGESDLAVLYVGRIAAEKNLELAAEAFRAIQRKHPRARFVLVGEGPAMQRFEEQFPDFLFCGLQVGTDLAECYASADLFLFPSLTETFGNVVCEALASGVPVVAFDYAAASHFVRAGRNGYVAEFGDHDAFVQHASVLANIALDLPDLRRNARAAVAHLEPS